MDSEKLKILYVATEVEDLAKTGGLADVAKALPIALKKRGHDVRIVCPFYPQVRERMSNDALMNSELSLQLGDQQYLYNLHRLDLQGVTVYGIDYPPYFARQGMYDNGYHPYADNGERFAFFSMAALQLAQALDFAPDIIHCNDWHTAMTPFFLRHLAGDNQFFAHTRTVLTLHNAAYQGVFDLDAIPFHGLLKNYLTHDLIERGSHINFLKCGIKEATKINAVSNAYAEELLTPLGSHQMYDILQSRKADLHGILNGCNYEDWNPQEDPFLPANYSKDDMQGKVTCKQHLQRYFNLPQREDVPMFGMVSRLTEQKGFHLLLPTLAELMEDDLQVVVVGSGDPKLAQQFYELMQKYPQKLFFMEGYTTKIAHLVQAAADFFLMPSLFEPCGLTQMYSLTYGSLPIVREVGGLRDTVISLNGQPKDGANGFTFQQPEHQALLSILQQALSVYREHPELYRQLQRNAMSSHFSWVRAAEEYEQLYFDALHGTAQELNKKIG